MIEIDLFLGLKSYISNAILMGVTRNLNSLKLLTQYDCNFGYVMVFGGGA
jgi:hypothetical protein